MKWQKGVLYEHANRPEWGHAMLLEERAASVRLLFTDAGEKLLAKTSPLRLATTEPKAQPARVVRTGKPGPKPRAKKPNTCPNCGGERPAERWACDACRERKAEQKRARRKAAGPCARGLGYLKGPAWTPEENQLLEELVEANPKMGDRQLAEQLGRSVAGVRARRLREGLRKRDITAWTDSDTAQLKAAVVGRVPMVKVAEQLGRTRRACYNQVYLLGGKAALLESFALEHLRGGA